MSTASRWKLTAVALMVAALALFLIAWTAHTWNGIYFLSVVCALGGAFATFGADE